MIIKKIKSALIKLYCRYAGGNPKISDREFVSRLFRISFGYKPDLDNPITFNEHIAAIKISEKEYGLSPYADKYAVRKYVSETVGEQYLNPCIGVYKTADEIPFEKLPKAFAMKCTHASGYNIIVTDREKLNREEAVGQLNKWLNQNYYYVGRERNYKNIPPAVMIDSYIDFKGKLNEYKIFCFHGKAEFIDVNLFTDSDRKIAVYGRDWKYIPVTMGYKNCGDCIKKPDNLEEMISVAESLASPFDFVRVDLYNNGGKILFSELTFTPGGGLVKFSPAVYDKEFGRLFEEKQ